jgi:DNA-binding NarL/FixJ family response regulator
MAEKIKVLAVDDHPLLREGITAVMQGEEDMELVAAATNGLQSIELFRFHRPDVTLMDLQMLDAIRAVYG